MKKRYTETQIVSKLRQADVLISKGQTVPDVCRRSRYPSRPISLASEVRRHEPGNGQGVKRAPERECSAEAHCCRPGGRPGEPEGSRKKRLTPATRREAASRVREKLGHSERKICRALGQHRSTQRYVLKMPEKDRSLMHMIKKQAHKKKHRKYGYRRICEILCREDLWVNHKRTAPILLDLRFLSGRSSAGRNR